jgi:hypothetical protein
MFGGTKYYEYEKKQKEIAEKCTFETPPFLKSKLNLIAENNFHQYFDSIFVQGVDITVLTHHVQKNIKPDSDVFNNNRQFGVVSVATYKLPLTTEISSNTYYHSHHKYKPKLVELWAEIAPLDISFHPSFLGLREGPAMSATAATAAHP